MSVPNKELTDGQIARLKHSVKNRILIPKDIRKKIYFIALSDIKIGQGYRHVFGEIIGKYIILNDINILDLFPNKEISYEAYNSFIGRSLHPHVWDSNDEQGLRNRLSYLKYLIDQM